MAKNIIKEIIIILVLCLAIILLTGILLYDYVPSKKVIPEKVSYTTPENVKEELNKTQGIDESQVVLTYDVDATDLRNYKRVNDYVPGKQNPFSSYIQPVEDTEGDNTTNPNGNSTTGNTTSGNTTIKNNTSSGSYIPDKGTK